MPFHRITLLIAIGFVSGVVASYLYLTDHETTQQSQTFNDQDQGLNRQHQVANPFSSRNPDDNSLLRIRIENLESTIDELKQKILLMENSLVELNSNESRVLPAKPALPAVQMSGMRVNRRLYDVDNLVSNGIDPGTAEDIVRRKNQVELLRLELQDKAQREGYLNTERYFEELAAIDAQDVDLRTELGDERYDEYLYNSKMHNRVRITSVIIGSEAERVGIQQNDIVLSYDNKRMFDWQELKEATAEGQLGEFVPIIIERDGEIFSFTVPRGPLGVQLGVARIEP
jgi:hypothetical protein